ncbi:MAG: right-handed parallel beta-helix repeat-containing protein, partial [Christensenellaceae bacterium]|nr:right-handed parallel beta-helix repeat-containing protein [Christensenellaceae bacterium]
PTTGHWDYGGAVMNITHVVQGATNSVMEDCIIEEAGFYSLAICAGDNFIVRNNTFRNMSTFAVDFEDGWEYMNNIVLESNNFINCSGDITMSAGDNITLIRNNFAGAFYLWPRPTNFKIIANNFIKNGANNFIYMQYYSEVIISRNVFDGYNYLNIWRVDPTPDDAELAWRANPTPTYPPMQNWGGYHGWIAGDVKIDNNIFKDTTVMTRNDIYITGKKKNPTTGLTYTGVEDMTGHNGNTNGVRFTNCTFTSQYDTNLYKTQQSIAQIQKYTGISGLFDNCVFDGVIASFFGGEIKNSTIKNCYINVKDRDNDGNPPILENTNFINCTVEDNNTFTGMTDRLTGIPTQ